MRPQMEKLGLRAGANTEDMLNYVFSNLSDDDVDAIKLERVSPVGDGVARELVTTGAIITLSAVVLLRVLSLVERWMEVQRQRNATELVYLASKENAQIAKELAAIEKKHADVMVKYGKTELEALVVKSRMALNGTM